MLRKLMMHISCRWAASRLHRYVDGDRSVPLSAAEVVRLEGHLRQCARCRGLLRDYRTIHGSLRRLGDRRMPDQASVARVRHLVEELAGDG